MYKCFVLTSVFSLTNHFQQANCNIVGNSLTSRLCSKKALRLTRNNYRQISLTSIVCKVVEKIVESRVIDFWRNISILYLHQFACLDGRSTLSELLPCYDDWAKSCNNKKPTAITFLDFSKPFDSVPHECLLFKLERHDIDDSALQWFRIFLKNASSRVVLALPGLQFYLKYPRE